MKRAGGKAQTHLVGVVYTRAVDGSTRALSVSRRYCPRCHTLCLAVRGLKADHVELVDMIRPSLDAGVDLVTHQCGPDRGRR